MQCTIEGCEKTLKARGMCAMHYYRWSQHGDLNSVQRTSRGEPERFINGLSMTGSGCVTWPYSKNNKGYAQINIGRGRKSLVSRILCERLNGPPPSDKHQAAHLCGKGHLSCVAPWHLAWKLPIENAADIDLHGNRAFGEGASWSVLDENGVRLARSLCGQMSQREIASLLGVTQKAIGNAIRGISWGHVPGALPNPPRCKPGRKP